MVLISTSCMSPSWSLDAIFYRRFSLANTVGNLHAKKNVLNRKSNLKKTTFIATLVRTIPLFYQPKVIMALTEQSSDLQMFGDKSKRRICHSFSGIPKSV